MSVDQNNVNDSYFINADGVKLFEQIWLPEDARKIKALVFIIHGLNEHSSFFYEDTVVKPLTNISCLVVAHDNVGHGRSHGDRKVVGKIDNLARDVISHIENIRVRMSLDANVPTFLYGHSLGGLIACIISLERSEIISGMVLEAPALCVDNNASSSWITFTAARLVSCVMPKMVLRKPTFINLSRNQKIVQEAADDIYRNKDGLTLGTAVNITNAIFSITSRLKDIKTPFFVCHGAKDVIVPVLASQTLLQDAAVTDKTLHIYENALHLLRGDIDNVGEDFKCRTVQWIESRIK